MQKKELIFKGISLQTTKCKYIWVHKGESTSLVEKDNKVLELTWDNSDSKVVANSLGLPHIGRNNTLDDMQKPELIPDTTVTLNGIKLKKLTWDPHIIKIVIVNDSDSKVSQDYWHTTIVISKDDYQNTEFYEYLFWSGGLKFLTPCTPKRLFQEPRVFYNFPKIIISHRSLDLKSESQTIYTLRNKYDEYIIRSIDYQEQFFTELRRILDEYGIQLVRYNREETISKTAYISYRISSTPSKYNHPKYSDVNDTVLQHRVPIDFEFRCTNMQMYYDFKNKFNNVDLLTNFCEFKTTDKYGNRWTAAIKWGKIGEDFNHSYEQDNNSNFSYQCQFSCELYFYEVYDKSTQFLKEIILDLETDDPTKETYII